MKKLTYILSAASLLVWWCAMPIPSPAERHTNTAVQTTECVDDVDIIIPEHITEKASEKIRQFEGCVLTSYTDSKGRIAIGYGHCGDVKPGTRISQGYADHLFYEDIAYTEQFVRDLDICTSQQSFDAIVSFVYNIGESAFINSKVYDYMKNGGTDEQIRAELKKWIYADGKVSRGLVSRRNWEAKAFYE